MAYAIETLFARLEKKNNAIAKRAATTKKHSQRYIKKGQKPEWPNSEHRWSCGDLENSTKELRYLIQEKRKIVKLIEDAKKNQIILPNVLVEFRDKLTASFINTRTNHREYLKDLSEKKTWENEDAEDVIGHEYCEQEYARMLWKDFGTFDYFGHSHRQRKLGPLSQRQQEIFNAQKIIEYNELWERENRETYTESDESIAKRSAKDAKSLVEDLYKRTFGFTGKTTDYDGLTIDVDNNGYSIINGVVHGENGSCKVTSIGAGGYNIQCWHIRVLVNAI